MPPKTPSNQAQSHRDPSLPPVILATWKFGQKATEAGWPHLVAGTQSSLDAVEQACRAVEADPEVMTVGRGGYPDRAGEITLDGSIMLAPDRSGAVCCVRRSMHPVSVARLVMEKSPHVMLAGDGAERFAGRHGIEPVDLDTEKSRAAWKKWVEAHPEARQGEPFPHNEFHDTVGVLARDAAGQIAGACSTSGLPYKLPGRVGDSPIIGHGLYVDPRCGAAVATGWGELIMGVCGSFLAVELMRRGASPRDAGVEMLQRIVDTHPLGDEHQVGVITLSTSGQWSSAALRPGYRTVVQTPTGIELVDPDHVMFP
jgi:N4-(beta-N-acetylglucosaminyl)-L-asparaginase